MVFFLATFGHLGRVRFTVQNYCGREKCQVPPWAFGWRAWRKPSTNFLVPPKLGYSVRTLRPHTCLILPCIRSGYLHVKRSSRPRSSMELLVLTSKEKEEWYGNLWWLCAFGCSDYLKHGWHPLPYLFALVPHPIGQALAQGRAVMMKGGAVRPQIYRASLFYGKTQGEEGNALNPGIEMPG